MTAVNVCGLYAITDSQLLQGRLIPAVAAAIAGGVHIVQYRDKTSPPQQRLQQADALCQLCMEHEVLFIVNDDIQLAAEVAADGVHIGKEDGSLQKARTTLGRDAIIGVSCYNQLELALQAQQQGADYVAFGRFFASTTKPAAIQADLQLLQQAKKAIQLPIVAIGGITSNNGAQLLQHGADALAVIYDLFGYDDVQRQAQQYQPLFTIPKEF